MLAMTALHRTNCTHSAENITNQNFGYEYTVYLKVASVNSTTPSSAKHEEIKVTKNTNLYISL